MDRVFLDANILFSAAYRRDAGLRRLWQLPDAELVTSAYALEEARRNLADRTQRARLTRLMRAVTIAPGAEHRSLPAGIGLPPKDRPILLAAIEAGATHLLTGDVTHFGRYHGKQLEGVLILPPAEYLSSREK